MYAQMWRISNDIWDGWRFIHEPPKEDDFPIGVLYALGAPGPYASGHPMLTFTEMAH
jgi:alpha-galactosidase